MGQSNTAGTIAASAICLVVGLLLILASFFWQYVDDGQAGWTNEDAVELQEAAAKRHELTFTVSPTSSAEEKEALHAALDRERSLEEKRDRAISSAAWRKQALRWTGLALGIIGISLSMLKRK